MLGVGGDDGPLADRHVTLRDAPAGALVVLAVVAVAAIQWRWPAAHMEEGYMVEMPLRILHGATIDRSFDYFYGPVSLWLPAALYWLFGASLATERVVGTAYMLVLGLSLFWIGRRRSALLGAAMGVCSVVVIQFSSVGVVTALPVVGAIGFAALGLALGTSHRRTRTCDVGCAAAFAVAASLRPDFALWGLLLAGAMCALGLRPRRIIAVYAVFAAVPYAVLVVTAGFSNVWTAIVVDSLRLPGERRLPIGHAGWAEWVTGLLLVAIGAALLGARRRGEDRRFTVTVALLFGLGLCVVPEFVQRADISHLSTLAGILAGVGPAAAYLGLRAPRSDPLLPALAAVTAAATLLAGAGVFSKLGYSYYRGVLAGRTVSYAVTSDGRTWYYPSPRAASSARALLRVLDGRSGDHVFVGPANLARTTTTDNSLYFLLRSDDDPIYFYDFYPGIALHQGQRLAAEVAAADTVVLWEAPEAPEPNASREAGSPLAGDVVASRFHRVATAGWYAVYTKVR